MGFPAVADWSRSYTVCMVCKVCKRAKSQTSVFPTALFIHPVVSMIQLQRPSKVWRLSYSNRKCKIAVIAHGPLFVRYGITHKRPSTSSSKRSSHTGSCQNTLVSRKRASASFLICIPRPRNKPNPKWKHPRSMNMHKPLASLATDLLAQMRLAICKRPRILQANQASHPA